MLISSRAPSTIAASIDLALPDALAFDQRGEDAERRAAAAAAEVADEVDRRDRRTAGGADVPEHAGERDVVDVVADVVGERAVLAPPGHAPVDEPRVARAARRPDRRRAARRRRAGILRCSTSATRRARSTTSAASGCLRSIADAAPAAVDAPSTATPESADARPARDVASRGRGAAPRRRGRRAPCPRTASVRCSGARRRGCPRAVPARRSRHSSSLKTRAAFSRRNFGQTWSRNGTSGSSEKMRS